MKANGTTEAPSMPPADVVSRKDLDAAIAERDQARADLKASVSFDAIATALAPLTFSKPLTVETVPERLADVAAKIAFLEKRCELLRRANEANAQAWTANAELAAFR
jgi:hypothetical protein